MNYISMSLYTYDSIQDNCSKLNLTYKFLENMNLNKFSNLLKIFQMGMSDIMWLY